jgi:threonine/homoserine/homoserine lactone efflux protein
VQFSDSSEGAERQSFVRGFLVGASNPKALVFFTALFPQFIDPTQPRAPQFLVLCLTSVFFELFWLIAYAAMGVKAKRWLQ